MMARLGFIATLLGGLAAHACAVCGQSGSQGQGAYIQMTWIMSFLPLLAIGGVVFFVFWKSRGHHNEPPAPPAAPPVAPPAPAQPGV